MIRPENCIEPGDVTGFEANLITKDGKQSLITFLKACHIYQDILSPYWTGQFQVYDTANLITSLPIEVGMKLELKWKTDFTKDVQPAEMEFVIYAIANRQFINRNLTTYTLMFATEDFILDKEIRIAGNLPEKKSTSSEHYDYERAEPGYPEDIIDFLVSTHLKDNYKVEKNDNKSKKPYSINPNNWSLFYTISVLTKMMVHELETDPKEDAADFLFYRKSQVGSSCSFVVKSIHDLYNNKDNQSGFKFKQIPGNSGTSAEKEMSSILNFKIKHFDINSNLDSGAEGGQVIEFDMSKLEVNFKSSKFTNNTKRKRVDLIVANPELANILFRPVHRNSAAGHNSDNQELWIKDRKRRLMALEEDKLLIQVHGDSRLTTCLGKTCEVEFPPLQDHVNPDANSDEDYNGKFLITAIRHSILPTRYFVNLSLVKLKLKDS